MRDPIGRGMSPVPIGGGDEPTPSKLPEPEAPPPPSYAAVTAAGDAKLHASLLEAKISSSLTPAPEADGSAVV